MRPIKFRAWDKDLKKMFQVDTLDLMGLGLHFTHHALPEETASGQGCRRLQNCELMQFVDFLDKDGTEVYEGDWIRIRYTDPNNVERDYIGAVEYHSCQFQENNEFYPLAGLMSSMVEVIGNIYEEAKCSGQE